MQQEGPSVTISVMSECHYNGKCVKLHGLTYIAVLFIPHRFRPHPFSLLVVSVCLIHGVHMVNSCRDLLRNSHTRIENFVPLIRLSTL